MQLCKRLVSSRLQKSRFPCVSRVEFIRSKLSNFSSHVYVVIEHLPTGTNDTGLGLLELSSLPALAPAATVVMLHCCSNVAVLPVIVCGAVSLKLRVRRLKGRTGLSFLG